MCNYQTLGHEKTNFLSGVETITRNKIYVTIGDICKTELLVLSGTKASFKPGVKPFAELKFWLRVETLAITKLMISSGDICKTKVLDGSKDIRNTN
jgi:hypothetical protein